MKNSHTDRKVSDETVTAGGDATASPHVGVAANPDQIGKYRVIRRIGEGGMGTVFEAEQQYPRRVVALKIIRTGLATDQVLRRFEHEAQALGRLQHPGIAQIFEAGTAETGSGVQPYFAMELVRGVPLNEYVKTHSLGIRERLELLVQICEAVHHAHQKSVIHRDLKPANILVDETGRAKIVDFGIARLTDADVQATALRTGVGQLVGTIAYMSPEQLKGNSAELDIRSDVYSLGVIGYELIVECLPYDVQGKPIPEVVRIIDANEPTPLGSIDRIYRGDIETIFVKALEKDKTRRYQSTLELSADIRRYLQDEPILARPHSAVYQLKKFATRHRALVGSAAAIFFGLAVGLAGTAYGMVQAMQLNKVLRAERDRADLRATVASKERDRASQKAARAGAVSEFFLEDLTHEYVPEDADGKQAALELLDKTSLRVETILADRPEIQAEVYDRLGDAYQRIKVFDKAEKHLRRAIDLRHLCGVTNGDEELLSCMRNLGVVLLKSGKLDQAEPICRSVVETARRVHGDEHVVTLKARSDLADILCEKGHVGQSEVEYRRVLEDCEKVLGPGDVQTVQLQLKLGGAILKQGEPVQAEIVFRAALEQSRKSLGGAHPLTLQAIYDIGSTLNERGRYAEVEPLLIELHSRSEDLSDAELQQMREVGKHLVLVYAQSGDADRVAKWRDKLKAMQKRSSPN